ncbi:MAG: recombinase family protein [Micavibrio sp.]
MMEEKKILRCAIYTRKSTEEGLDMDYNTLDAQREAGEKYVEAMRGEGWRVIPDLYDDGGFSGGNMDRPALKRLIGDIEAGRIDIVVVYKVDRLSRSLMDFAKLVEILDKHGTSFVSVTQHFNTKDSMGRLTLNILLSFAQFEREVTGERIRDKFAASKMKGMWMGGPPPLGYDVTDRKLVTNPKEAALVNHIFDRFVALGSLSLLVKELNETGHRTKHYTSRTGKSVGGKLFTENPLRTFLKNRILLGEIHHKGKYFPGLHQPIITQAQFDAAQAVFAENSKGKRKRTFQAKSKALLKGILFCGRCGGAMSPTHTNKGKKNYHYYAANSYRKQSCALCPTNRIPAGEIEEIVMNQIQSIFAKPQIIVDVWKKVKADIPNYSENELRSIMQRMGALWDILVPAEHKRITHLLIDRVAVHGNCIDIEYRANGIEDILFQLQQEVEQKIKNGAEA